MTITVRANTHDSILYDPTNFKWSASGVYTPDADQKNTAKHSWTKIKPEKEVDKTIF